MVWMTLFHFSFDLSHYGLLTGQNFYTEVFWTAQRTAIVSLFLLCAGMGQGLAHEQQLGWSRFFGRWWRIVACAALVSAGSWWIFPRSWISFGVLHGIAVMLVLTRLAAPLRGWLWPLGALALACSMTSEPSASTRSTPCGWIDPARWMSSRSQFVRSAVPKAG